MPCDSVLQCTALQISTCWAIVDSKEIFASHYGGVFSQHTLYWPVQLSFKCLKGFHCFPSKTRGTSLRGTDTIGKSHLTKDFLATLGICYNSFFTISKRYEDPNWTTVISKVSTVRRGKGRKLSETVTGAYLSNEYIVREEREAQLCFMFSVSIVHLHNRKTLNLSKF